MQRHSSILQRENTGLLIIDIQEKISAVMKYREDVLTNTIKLIKGFQVFKLPIFITEQYRKGLGPTAPEILAALGTTAIFEKMTFSCCGLPSLMNQLQDSKRQQIVLCGIETHVCVQQTALDLLANGFQVYLIADAVSSRHELDHKTAIQRMRQAGVIVTTTESVLFELLVAAKTEEFKPISQLVK